MEVASPAAIVTVPDGFEEQNVSKGAGGVNGTQKHKVGRYAMS